MVAARLARLLQPQRLACSFLEATVNFNEGQSMKFANWVHLGIQIMGVLASASPLKDRLAQRYLVGGHRGGGYTQHSDNTIEQYKNSIKLGVDILEMDVQLTKDLRIMVYHDGTLDGKTKCTGTVRDFNFDDLRKNCFYKSTKETIPTLDEVIFLIDHENQNRAKNERENVIMNIELKVGPQDNLDQSFGLLIKTLVDGGVRNYTYLQAYPQFYPVIRKIDPDFSVLYNPSTDQDLQENVFNNPDPNLLIVELHERNRTKAVIDRIHQQGRLASENSWKFSKPLIHERFYASCDVLFGTWNMDIAITNNVKSCVQQRNKALSHAVPRA